jgi:hypothetical protein
MERSKILGDTVALPFYWIGAATYRASALAMLGRAYNNMKSIIEDCLEDLGLERRLSDELEWELELVKPSANIDEDFSVNQSDVIRTGSRFVIEVIRTWTQAVDIGSDISKLQPLLKNLEGQIRESREESNEHMQRLENLIQSGNKEIIGYFRVIQEKLIQKGFSKEQALAVTQNDPKGFWERFDRWQAKTPWRDVIEEAIWEALEFVPGGKGVTIGLRIARAVRRSLKARSR